MGEKEWTAIEKGGRRDNKGERREVKSCKLRTWQIILYDYFDHATICNYMPCNAMNE
jgi:hypothetical protein